MKNHQHYRIVTPDGRLSHDKFVIADQQPSTLQEDCLLMVDETDGRQVAVHDTRLFPPEAAGHAPFDDPAACVCKECGKVEGLEGDQVACPYGSDVRCGMVEPLEEEAEGLLGALRFEIVEARHYRPNANPPPLLVNEQHGQA
jgi:hypothetical protein